MSNPIVFFDIAVGNVSAGRIKMELLADQCPKTSENFRQLCTGEFRRNGLPFGYKGCKIHRAVKGKFLQGGDVVRGDGTGPSISIYGDFFADENFQIKHDAAGILSMANRGPNTNGCQFILTTSPCPSLDGNHVAFGRVIDGMAVLKKIESIANHKEESLRYPVVITECGEY